MGLLHLQGIVVDLFTLELLDVVHDNTLNIYLNDTDGIILVMILMIKRNLRRINKCFFL